MSEVKDKIANAMALDDDVINGDKINPGQSHSFAIMAYKSALYIEQTILSVLSQTVKSDVFITTSTPSDYIAGIAEKYRIPLFINTGEKGIKGDWEFALSCARTQYVTLAHQDDIYLPCYTQTLLALFNKHENAVIAFSNYNEIDLNGDVRKKNQTLRIKRILFWPYLFKDALNKKRWKKMILRFGNPICAPSVMYNLHKIKFNEIFDSGYPLALDWRAWIDMVKLDAAFCYSKNILMSHRIHEISETTAGIQKGQRYDDDLRIFTSLWPKWIAEKLTRFYSASYKSNHSNGDKSHRNAR